MNNPDAPWVPETLAQKLVVGARVRVRSTAECTHTYSKCGVVAYHRQFDGQIGEIIFICDLGPPLANSYCHQCEEKTSVGPMHIYSICFPKSGSKLPTFAAIELVPAED